MIDHVALLPAYLAAGTAVLVLLADLLVPGRRVAPLGTAALGAAATAAVSGWLGATVPAAGRGAFCRANCSYVLSPRAAALMALFAVLTLGVLALSAGADVPAGEYAFLLACSLTGAVVLAGAADLITLLVALETVTLPLYVLVGLRRRGVASAEAAVTFLVVSVVSTAVSLLGAALLYASTGALHFPALRAALGAGVEPALRPLTIAGTVLLLTGLGFKVAAVPLHGWAPATYDGAPLPVAAYLSTASKLSGVVAIGYVVVQALPPGRDVPLVVLAVLSMTVGNLVALRQRRMVRLLAWSSIAQAGYILAAFTVPDGARTAFAYAAFFVLLELAAFGAVIALRGATGDGGELGEYAGAARRAPWRSVAFALALAGLAGLPPGVAGLFAKVTVIRSLVDNDSTWLAIVVAVNAVIGLAYYVRAGASLFTAGDAVTARPRWTVALALAVITAVGLTAGFAPQLVLDAVASR